MTKKNISSIFKEKGEEYFRDIEEQICCELLKHKNCIVSLGGGSIINNKIRKIIKKNSFSIYLQVELKNLLDRLKSERLENLFNDRRRFYEEADLIINNNDDKFQVLDKIASELNFYAK